MGSRCVEGRTILDRCDALLPEMFKEEEEHAK